MSADTIFDKTRGRTDGGAERHQPLGAPEPSRPPSRSGPKRRGCLVDLIGRFFFFFFQVLKLLIVGGAVCLATGWIGYTLVQRNIQKVEVTVPNLTVRYFDDAAALLHEKNLDLSLRIEKKEFSDDVEEGRIISQAPPTGTHVKAGAVVRVVVSLGTTRIPCPDLRGTPFRDAGIALRKGDLAEGKKSYVADPKVKKDFVIAQSPPPGAPLYRETPVDLLVSLGTGQARVRMPDLRNLTRLDAADVLAELGLRITSVAAEPHPTMEDGAILRHDPPANSAVTPATPISVTIVDNRGLR